MARARARVRAKVVANVLMIKMMSPRREITTEAKGSGKFAKQRVTDVNPHVLEPGNVARMKYRSKLPMTSEREHPKKLYILYCIKNLAPAHNDESNPFLEAWL